MTMPRITFWRVVFVVIMLLGAYATFIRREFTDHIDIPACSVRGPNGLAEDLLHGTLLDHRTYSFEAARPALEMLANHTDVV